MPQPSLLDARLAEIDRRLRTIQSGLAPAPQSAALVLPRTDTDPATGRRAVPTTGRRAVPTTGRRAVRPEGSGPVSVSAGPFASTDALKRFERALLLVPEVRQVVVREYASGDRAVVDVHLFGPIS